MGPTCMTCSSWCISLAYHGGISKLRCIPVFTSNLKSDLVWEKGDEIARLMRLCISEISHGSGTEEWGFGAPSGK